MLTQLQLFFHQTLKTFFFPYLRLLLEALGKFPAPTPSSPKTFYRGVKEALLELEPFAYYNGADLVWLAVTSLTDNIDVLSNPMFLGDAHKQKKKQIFCPFSFLLSLSCYVVCGFDQRQVWEEDRVRRLHLQRGVGQRILCHPGRKRVGAPSWHGADHHRRER